MGCGVGVGVGAGVGATSMLAHLRGPRVERLGMKPCGGLGICGCCGGKGEWREYRYCSYRRLISCRCRWMPDGGLGMPAGDEDA